MSNFMPTTASNGPRVKDHEAVENIIASYFFDLDFNVGIGFDHETGAPSLFIYGESWPEAWKIPAGIKKEDFDPYTEEHYEDGADGFVQLLKEIGPFLEEPLTVHAVGHTRCWFPLSASEWHIEAGGQEVQINEFRHGYAASVTETVSANSAQVA